MKQISRPRRRIPTAALVFLVLMLGVTVAFAARNRIEDVAIAPAPAGTALPTAAALSPADDAFYRYVGARMRALSAESAKLVELGEARSRNVMELQIRANRIDQISGQIDDYLATSPVPPRFQPALDRYTAAVAIMRAGIAATKSAFFAFDWDGVAAGLATFEQGTSQLDSSYRLLQEAAGVSVESSPVASPAAGLATPLGLA
jgi:hypothetical protein